MVSGNDWNSSTWLTRWCDEPIAASTEAVKRFFDENHKDASRLAFRHSGSLSKRGERQRRGEAELDAPTAAQQLAARFDRRLGVELDRDALAQEVADVLGEVVAAKCRRRVAHHLEQPGVPAPQVEAIGALLGEREHLEAE